MIKEISSKDNKIYKDILKLKKRVERDKTRLFVAEGARLCEDALKSGCVKYMIVDEQTEPISKDVTTYRFSNKLFEQITDVDTPQGVAAVCEMKKHNIKKVFGNRLIICDGLGDPGNVGTIIRTAECSGADGVIIMPFTADPFSPKVVRSTMGSIFRLPIYFAQYDDLKILSDYDILAATLDGAEDLYQLKLNKMVAIVIGNEARGVCEQTLAYAKGRVKIPMYGGAESLNAAVAAGVIMYEALRQNREV